MSTSDPEHRSSSPTPAEPEGTPEPTSTPEPTGTAQPTSTPEPADATGPTVSGVRGTQPTPSVGGTPAHEPPATPPARQAPVEWPAGSSAKQNSDPATRSTQPAEPDQARVPQTDTARPHDMGHAPDTGHAPNADTVRSPEADTARRSPDADTARPPAAQPDPFPTREPAREPRRGAGFGGHQLGILIGAVLSVFALVLLLLGEARILGSEDPTAADGIGIVLVTLAALLLAMVVYLGVWTAALPITGGVVLTVVGGFYLYFPTVARDETLRLLATDASRETVIYGIIASTMGMTFVVGVLLLAAGWALAVARRRGRALGAFRERQRTP